MRKIRPLSAQELDMYKRIAERFGRPSAPPSDTATTSAYPSAVA
jgi:hypothetical protein